MQIIARFGLKITPGQESVHEHVVLNGMKGRLFSSPKFRLAMQYLLWRLVLPQVTSYKILAEQGLFFLDPQFFLPLQQGRISAEEIDKIIDGGKDHVGALVSASRKNPVIVYTRLGHGWILDEVKRLGLAVDEKSKEATLPELANEHYKKFTPDLMLSGSSVISGDPDGIYHLVGAHGAIASPMLLRSRVSELVEEGRSIVKIDDVGPHYSEVNRAILQDVPFVHVGVSRAHTIYNHRRMKVRIDFVRRNEGHLHIFEALD